MAENRMARNDGGAAELKAAGLLRPDWGEPLPGERWRHYKGGLYEVVARGVIEATCEPAVVYRSAKPDERHQVFIRPLSNWTEDVPGHGRRFTFDGDAAPVGEGERLRDRLTMRGCACGCTGSKGELGASVHVPVEVAPYLRDTQQFTIPAALVNDLRAFLAALTTPAGTPVAVEREPVRAFVPSHWMDSLAQGWIVGMTQKPDDAEEWVAVEIREGAKDG